MRAVQNHTNSAAMGITGGRGIAVEARNPHSKTRKKGSVAEDIQLPRCTLVVFRAC